MAFPLQAPDVGTGDAERGQLLREHPPPVRLDQPVPEGRHAVRQGPRLQAEGGSVGYRAVPADRLFPHLQPVAVQGRVPEPPEHLPALHRVADLHDVRDLVQRHPLQHARQAEAVSSVKVGDVMPVTRLAVTPANSICRWVPSPGSNSSPSPSQRRK